LCKYMTQGRIQKFDRGGGTGGVGMGGPPIGGSLGGLPQKIFFKITLKWCILRAF